MQMTRTKKIKNARQYRFIYFIQTASEDLNRLCRFYYLTQPLSETVHKHARNRMRRLLYVLSVVNQDVIGCIGLLADQPVGRQLQQVRESHFIVPRKIGAVAKTAIGQQPLNGKQTKISHVDRPGPVKIGRGNLP